MTQTEQLDPDTVARAAARLPAILHPPQSSGLKADLDRIREEAKELPPLDARTRKQRSDAGKPRESFYVSIPGVRFDMSRDEGRDAFVIWFNSAITATDMHPQVVATVHELLREIDRLRAK